MDILNEQLRTLQAELAEFEDGDEAAYKEAYREYEEKKNDIFTKMSEVVLPDYEDLNGSDSFDCCCYSFSLTENEDGTISQSFKKQPVTMNEIELDGDGQVWFGAYVPGASLTVQNGTDNSDDSETVWEGAIVPGDCDVYCWDDINLADEYLAELESLNAQLDALAAALPEDEEGNEAAYKAYEEKKQEIEDKIFALIGNDTAESDTLCGYSYSITIPEDGTAATGVFQKLSKIPAESGTDEIV